MKPLAALAAVAALSFAPSAQAQDLAGMLAATAEQIGQGLGESASAGAGIFVTAQGKAPLPRSTSGGTMTITVSGSGATATEAARERDEELAKVLAAARRFGVTAEPGKTTWSIGEDFDYASAYSDAAVEAVMVPTEDPDDAPTAMDAMPEATTKVTASIQVKVGRPEEARIPGFIDALTEAGVEKLDDTLNGLDLGQFGPFLSLLGLDIAADPGEAVWNAATADAMRAAREQAQAIASASGRQLGQVRNVTFLMRSQDGQNAVVSVAVRYGFAD